MAVDGYYDGLTDANGNLTDYGNYMINRDPPWAQRTGDGARLINGGVAMKGSANNPNGDQKNPDGTDAVTGATGTGQGTGGTAGPTPGAGTTVTPTLPDTKWSIQSLEIGDDGSAWLEVKHWDQGKQDYVYTTMELGNPQNKDFDWGLVAKNTGINIALLKAAYQKSFLDWQQTQAGQRAMSTWHFDSLNPVDGSIAVRNGAGVYAVVSYKDIMNPDWLAQHPGINLADVQKGIQELNRQNWMDTVMSQPGTAGYLKSKYFILGGQAQPGTPAPTPGGVGGVPGTAPGTGGNPTNMPPATAPPPPVTGTSPRAGGEIPGAAPTPAPTGRGDAYTGPIYTGQVNPTPTGRSAGVPFPGGTVGPYPGGTWTPTATAVPTVGVMPPAGSTPLVPAPAATAATTTTVAPTTTSSTVTPAPAATPTPAAAGTAP